jgi:hypothetical protein
MHRRVLFFVIIASLAMGVVGQRIYAQDPSHPLIKGVTDAKVTLQQGLAAAAQQGRPAKSRRLSQLPKAQTWPTQNRKVPLWKRRRLI